MQMWMATAANGISQRPNGAAGRGGEASAVLAGARGILPSVSAPATQLVPLAHSKPGVLSVNKKERPQKHRLAAYSRLNDTQGPPARPQGPRMPCGWKCGGSFTAT